MKKLDQNDRILALDLDGVIVHPAEEVGDRHWSADMATDLGVSSEALADAFFKKYWANVVVGRADLEEKLGLALTEIGSSCSPRALMDYWFRKDGRLDEEVARIAIDWRSQTSGLVVACSNQEKNRLQYLRDELNVDAVFDQLFWSGDLGVSKKEPRFFEVVLERLGVSPDALLFFDDEQPVVDVARSCGITAHLFVDAADLRSRLLENGSAQ